MNSKEKWISSEATFADKYLIINNLQVMQKWEEPYMKMLASIVTRKGGKILEVGFGLGISAKFIQKSNKIETHTIIEAHPDVIKFGEQLFNKEIKSNEIILINEFWENAAQNLPDESFDGILYDAFPLSRKESGEDFFEEAFRLLKKGGIFTFYSNIAKPSYRAAEDQRWYLKKAGFKNIKYEICEVSPPKECGYWKHKTIIAPIVIK